MFYYFRPLMYVRSKAVLCLLFICHFTLAYGQSLQKVLNLGQDPPFKVASTIADISTDSDNNLWIVYFGGVQRYDGTNAVFVNCFGVSNSLLLRFYEKKNGEKLVIDALNQIFYIEADTLRPSPLNDTLRKLSKGKFCTDFYFDTEDRLHITFPGEGYFVIDSNFHIDRPLKDIDLSGMVCLFNDERKPFTIKTKDKGPANRFFYVLSKDAQLINKCPIEEFLGKFPNSLVQLKNGNYLVSSGNGELFEFNSDGLLKKVPYHTTVPGLHRDGNGGLWVSTHNGVNFYADGTIDASQKQHVLNNNFSVPTFSDFQGGVWIGSQTTGLHHIPFPLYSMFSEQNGLIRSTVTGMEVIGNELLYGSAGDTLYALDLKGLDIQEVPVPGESGSLIDLKYDERNERTWASFRGSLIYSDGDSWKPHSLNRTLRTSKCYLNASVANDDIAVAGHGGRRYFYTADTTFTISEPFEQDISSLLIVGDSVYVGTDNGLYLEVNGHRKAMSEQFSPLKKIVEEMCYFDNRVWVSIRGSGLYILEKDSLIPILHHGYSIQNADLILEGTSHLWAINGYGCYMLSPTDEGVENGAYQIDMFAPIPVLGGNGWCSTDSSVFWIIDNKEVLRSDFDDIRSYPCVAPLLSITEFKVNDKYLPVHQDLYRFKHDENFFNVRYSAASYLRNRVVFRYRVRGLKDAWIHTNETVLQLIGLAPGSYELELQAQVVHQPWSETKRLKFEIIAPFWKRTWFIALECVLAFLIIYLVVSYRLRMANKEKKLILERLMADQKALKAQLNPHFIFNAINSVQYFIRAKRNEEAEEYVGLFADLARLVLENSEKRLVSFTQEMQLYTSQISLESMVLPNNEQIDLVFDVDGVDTDKVFVPPALLQPYIENAVWHGLRRKKGEKRIEIQLKIEEGMLVISVADNGIGRNAARRMKPKGKAVKSFGMKISSQRIDVLNQLTNSKSVVRIEDLMNEDQEALGTKIILKISLIQSDEITNS